MKLILQVFSQAQVSMSFTFLYNIKKGGVVSVKVIRDKNTGLPSGKYVPIITIIKNA